MADSLVLKGVKDVRKHKGSEMLLLHPKRGGNTHQVKEWWRVNAVNTTYTGCTIFRVTVGGDSVKLVLATGASEDSDIRIDHDGAFNFTFYHVNEISRAALFTDDMVIIEHYVFPSISGGKIMTVIPAGAADRPTDTPVTEIDEVSVSGEAAPTNGDTETYTAVVTGNAAPYTYTWTVSADGSIDSGQGTSSVDITWNADGAQSVTCVVGSTDGDWNNVTQEDTLDINVAVLFAVVVASADLSVAVTVADTGNGDKYQIDGVEQDSIVASVGASIHFDLSDASLSGHPFKIYTDSSKTTEVTVGIQQEGTDLVFTPPIAGSFSYQCSDHAGMGGDITVS